MSYYILKESLMNGTVTMSTEVSLVDAEDFRQAVAIIKQRLSELPSGCLPHVYLEEEGVFRYNIQNAFESMNVSGMMDDKLINVIRYEPPKEYKS